MPFAVISTCLKPTAAILHSASSMESSRKREVDIAYLSCQQFIFSAVTYRLHLYCATVVSFQ